MIPRSIANFALIGTLWVMVRAASHIHFGMAISPQEVLGYPLALSGLGAAYKLLPKHAQEWVERLAATVLASKRITNASFVALFCTTLCLLLFSTVTVSWSGKEPIEITLNGKSRVLRPSSGDATTSQTTLIRSSIRTTVVQVDAFHQVARPRPLRRAMVRVPFYATLANRADLWEIQHDLDLALLQNEPRGNLRRAEDGIAKLVSRAGGITDPALERLNGISQILRETLVDTSLSDAKARLIEAYDRRYPQDAWLPVFLSLASFAEPSPDAATRLEPSVMSNFPRKASVTFLRGLIFLRYGQRIRIDPVSKLSRRDDASAAFKTAAAEFLKARTEADAHGPAYRAFAVPATGVFAGIAYYYSRDFDAAERELRSVLALNGIAENVKARAANGVGYISFLKGRIAEANKMLSHAISLNPDMSIPRINQGYVFLATAQWENARRHFDGLLKRPAGTSELAPRDVLLAKLGLAHALSESTNAPDSAQAFALLQEVLRKLRVDDYDYIQDEGLQRGFQLASIARHVYLFNRDYYALEPVATMCLAKACEEECRSEAAGDVELKSDEGDRLRTELLWLINTALEATKDIQIVGTANPGFLRYRRMLSDKGCVCSQ